MVVQIVGIASYISVEAELLGRQEVEQEIEPKREVLKEPREIARAVPRWPAKAKAPVPK